jgi:hypothetical protein
MEHIREVHTSGGAGRDNDGTGGQPAPNTRIARRLTFCDDVERLMQETGTERVEAFRIYNKHFPTFDSYNAFKIFLKRHPATLHDPITTEITQTFSQFGTSDTRGLARRTRRELTDMEREEHRLCVQNLHAALKADPTFLNRLLDDYARLLMNRKVREQIRNVGT